MRTSILRAVNNSSILQEGGKPPKNELDNFISQLSSLTGLEEMRAARGKDFSKTGMTQIRLKPPAVGADVSALIKQVQAALSKMKKQGLEISDIQFNKNSTHSGKFSSVSFKMGDTYYDIVIARGANRGESFEKELLLKLDNLVTGISTDDEEAHHALSALQKIDPDFSIDNIKSITPRTGSTSRSAATTAEEMGAIIADIIVTLKNGGRRYISVKNRDGDTVAQFGVSDAFTDSLDVNTSSQAWKVWLAPLKLDAAKIAEGLRAARDGTELEWDDIVRPNEPIEADEPIVKILKQMFGGGYYYLRQKKDGFFATKIDDDYLSTHLLKNLKISEIRYPSAARKQLTIFLHSDAGTFKLELRNPSGGGRQNVKPTQLQLRVQKMNALL